MKKALLLLICLFSLKEVNAYELNSKYLPYYVLANDEVIQIKKISDDSGNDIFNIDYRNYDVSSDFKMFNEVNKTNFGLYFRNLYIFNNTTYYAYQNKNDLNYFLTQVLIWNNVRNANVKICDKLGNIISDYDKDYKKLYLNIINHNLNANFHNRTYNSEIWSDMTFTYYSNNIILDNPLVDGLKLSNDDLKLNIYNEKVGNYTLIFNKDYEENNISYTDGVNYYWSNLGGPADLEKKFYYNVYGTKLIIKENLIGINDKYGDALLNSSYELYLDNELKLTFDKLDNIYVKSNSNYLLKDISDNESVNNIENFEFKVLDEELEIIIDKYVISKNISIDIKDSNTYYIYLKSNDELYEVIDSSTDLITLPYGIYYVTDKNEYYEEIEILNSIDDVLIIDKKVVEENIDKVEDNIILDEIIKDNNNSDIVKEDILIDNNVIEKNPIDNNINDKTYVDEVCDNPKTGYSYSLYSVLIFVVLLSFVIVVSIKNKKFK